MKKNKLFIFISSFLFLLTSCGGVAPKGDPVVTFEGLGGTLVSGPETVSVPSGTLWSDISKPFFARNDTVSLFFTLVQDNIAYTVPNTFPVCADLTVFAYYSDTPYLSNQVVVFGDNIMPTTRSFPKDDFTPMTFGLIYKEGYPKEETTAIYDPTQADVVLSEDKLSLTVTPKTNDMITVLIGEDANQLIVQFDGNGGTVDGKPYVLVTVDPDTTFGDVTKPEPQRGDEIFACWSFTNDGKNPIPNEHVIVGPTRVYACYEQDTPVAQDYTITVEGDHIQGGSATFPEKKEGETFGTYDITYTIEEGYEYSDIVYDEDEVEVNPDEENPQIIHVTPKVNDNIDITIITTKKKISVIFDGNGGKSGGEPVVVVSNIDYGTTFRNINKPTFIKYGKEQSNFAFDKVGKQPVSDSYVLKDDNTRVYAHFNTLEINLVDDSMVVYGSTVISYSSSTDITVTSKPDNAVNFTIDENKKRIIIDSVKNTAANITITVKNETDTETCNLSVKYPATLQEASEAVDFALTRKLETFDLTFAYPNDKTEDQFYKNSVETRGCISSLGAQNWRTGTNQTISFKPAYRTDMGTVKYDITGTEYYYENLKNAAFEMRKVSTKATSLPIDKVEKTLSVHNSEGLFFALEHGFKPVIDSTEGALAENAAEVYSAAYNACLETYNYEDANGEYGKVRYLYDWLVNNTHRDYWIDSDVGLSDKNRYTSYYAEGVFLNNGVATDDGFAKAFAIMGGIEGLPIVRTTGTSSVEAESYTHAWNYYCNSNDGKWYSICPTWSHVDKSDTSFFNFNFSCNSYQPFMRSKTYFYDDSYDYAYRFLLATGQFDDATAKRMAISGSAQYNYTEGLFGELNKSAEDYSINAYEMDTFVVDKKTYNFNVKTTTDAEMLVKALPSSLGSENFTIDLPHLPNDVNSALKKALQEKFKGVAISETSNYVANYKNAELHILVKHA